MERYLETHTYEATYRIPPPGWLVVLSLGHREALADLLWTQVLIYFGEEHVHQGDLRHIYRYIDAMLALDPYFRAAYDFGGDAPVYRIGEVTVEDIRRAIAYLERGVRIFPDDGDLAWELGSRLNYELAPRIEDPVEKAAIKRRGLANIQAASRLGALPDWYVLASASQLERLGEIEQAVQHLEEMYASIEDAGVRERIEERLGQLKNEALAEGLARTVEALETERRGTMPYVDPPLFLLLRPRPLVNEPALYQNRFAPVDPTLESSVSDSNAEVEPR
jgi:tetratricopeptide (TPR) repeat protein